MPSKTFVLYSQPYLNTLGETYTNIITINSIPDGPLAQRITRISMRALSKFQNPSEFYGATTCALGIRSPRSHIGIVTIDELDDLLISMTEDGYIPNKMMTNMIRDYGNNTRQVIGMFQYATTKL